MIELLRKIIKKYVYTCISGVRVEKIIRENNNRVGGHSFGWVIHLIGGWVGGVNNKVFYLLLGIGLVCSGLRVIAVGGGGIVILNMWGIC